MFFLDMEEIIFELKNHRSSIDFLTARYPQYTSLLNDFKTSAERKLRAACSSTQECIDVEKIIDDLTPGTNFSMVSKLAVCIGVKIEGLRAAAPHTFRKSSEKIEKS